MPIHVARVGIGGANLLQQGEVSHKPANKLSCKHGSSCSSSSDKDGLADTMEVGVFTVLFSALLAALIKLKEEELMMKSSKGPQNPALVDACLASRNAVGQIHSCLKAKPSLVSLLYSILGCFLEKMLDCHTVRQMIGDSRWCGVYR